jgi:hypothetical protein
MSCKQRMYGVSASTMWKLMLPTGVLIMATPIEDVDPIPNLKTYDLDLSIRALSLCTLWYARNCPSPAVDRTYGCTGINQDSMEFLSGISALVWALFVKCVVHELV